MRQTRFLAVILAISLLGTTEAKQNKRVAVLPVSQAQSVSQLCSRDTPIKVEAGWLPTDVDIAVMEKKFGKIPKVQEQSRDSGVPIRPARTYYRQYIGVIVDGRRHIYVNVICDEKPPNYWRERTVNYCDGGCNWGVLYDVETGEFSSFGINGVG